TRSISINIVAVLLALTILSLTPAIARNRELSAYLQIDVASDGKAKLFLRFVHDGTVTQTARERIEKALSCRLTDKTYDPDSDEDSNGVDDTARTDSDAKLPEYHAFSGEGQSVVAGSRSMVDGTLDLSALLAALREAGIDSLEVSVKHPTAGYNYSPPGNGMPDLPALRGWQGPSFYSYYVDLQHPISGQSAVHIAFGYRPGFLIRRLAALCILLLLPIILAIRRRAQASGSGGTDQVSLRYGAMRTLNTLTLFLPISWYIVYSALGITGILKFMMPGRGSLTLLLVDLGLLFIPPLVCVFACTVLLAPMLKLEQSENGRGNVLRRFAFLVLGTYLPLLLVLASLDAAVNRHFELLIGFLGVAQLVRVISKSMLAKDASKQIYPLLGGPLRTRILDLAARSAVPPREIYIASEDATKSANACATSKKTIILNEFLVKRFTKREVDAVVGHEIGHIRLNHLGIRGAILYGGLVFAFFASKLLWIGAGLLALLFRPIVSILGYLDFSTSSYYLGAGIVLVLLLYASRRFEYSADAFAVTVTGDPEAMITTLGKLARLNLLPMSWARFDEGLFSHPSTLRRIKAIALQAGIPDYRVEALLDSPDSPEDRYSLTDTAVAAPVTSFTYPARDATRAPYPGVAGARLGARKRGGLNILVPFKHAPWLALASFLLFTPGGFAARQLHLDALGIPSYLAAISAGLITLMIDCARLKYKLLKARPKSLEFSPTTPENFPFLDNGLLAQRTAELEAIGFLREVDFTVASDPRKKTQAFARRFFHPVNKCFAEVGQVVAVNRALTPLKCSVFSYLQQDWSLSVSDREPDAYLYQNRQARKLFRWMTGSSPEQLLSAHLRLRNEMASTLGIGVLELRFPDYVATQKRDSLERRKEFQKRSILAYLLKIDIFQRNPKSEWLGEFARIRRKARAGGAVQYESGETT
ncbi:MAG TPA: M48 family metalloprotease, partial [Blastocatellia bacterium]|nr:M48 family metalloprotease [Blastocatellia bacterium]